MTANHSNLIGALTLAAILSGTSAAFAADAPTGTAPTASTPAVVAPGASTHPQKAVHVATTRASADLVGVIRHLDQASADMSQQKYRSARSALWRAKVTLAALHKVAPITERSGIPAIGKEISAARVAILHRDYQSAMSKVDAALVSAKSLQGAPATPIKS